MVYLLKGCRRCCGDLYANEDMYGRYVACLQCGHYLSEREVEGLNNPGVGLGFTASPEVLKEVPIEVPTRALAELAA